MNSNPKRQNRRGTIADDDRLSSLPDGILIFILSFILPTKYAARTSVLSKRWRDLFLDVSRIHIENTPGKTSDDEDLLQFVNRITLLGTSSPIHEFRLKCPTFLKTSSIYIWLASLLRRGVEVLEIDQVLRKSLPLGNKPPIHPPTGFFQSETLVVLKLNGGAFIFTSNESVWFPNLKVLSLQSLQMHLRSETLRFSDQGYPLLEELSLMTLWYPTSTQTSIEISLNTLKSLTIIDRNPIYIAGIDVDTPHLQRLECRYIASRLRLRKCETLESAVFTNINLAAGFGQTFMETLRAMNNLKALSLLYLGLNANPEDFKAHLGNSLHRDGPFPCLNHLEYFEPTPSYLASQFLSVLIHRAPNLRTLYFNSRVVPLCFRQNLAGIGLMSFKGTDAEVALVEWLMNQGALLQWIIIDCTECGGVLNVAAMNRLVKIGQLHPKCGIKFIPPN